ncbi:class I SAM-dependent methyltransferase [Patescibacteria group bacterium]
MDKKLALNNLKLIYSGKSNLYIQLRTRLFWSRFEKLVNLLPDQGRLVDIGCGQGLLLNLISVYRPSLTLVGVDTDSERISEAEKTINGRTNIKFYNSDAREFNFQTGDNILFVDSLHHIPYNDHRPLLQRLAQQVKHEGRLIISEVEKNPRWKYALSYLSDTLLYPSSTRCQFYSVTEMMALLKSTGWNDQSITKVHNIFPTVIYECQT